MAGSACTCKWLTQTKMFLPIKKKATRIITLVLTLPASFSHHSHPQNLRYSACRGHLPIHDPPFSRETQRSVATCNRWYLLHSNERLPHSLSVVLDRPVPPRLKVQSRVLQKPTNSTITQKQVMRAMKSKLCSAQQTTQTCYEDKTNSNVV